MEDKNFIIITDKGIVGSKGQGPTEILTRILLAFLEVWNREMFDIDVESAAKNILDMMVKMEEKEETEEDLYEILKKLFEGDE